MEYNTQLKNLILPEYGRNVHNMIDFCRTVEDREDRTRCAHSIIDIMGNMFPHLRDVNDFKHILWDHIAIMSNFDLNIDYPYEVIKKEDLYSKPEPLPYSPPLLNYRHYGKTLQRMVKIALTMDDEKEKEQFIVLIATNMKKSYIQWNKDVEDIKIFIDLFELSAGDIDLRTSNMKLPEMRDLNQRNNNTNTNSNNNSNTNNNNNAGTRRKRR